MTGAYSYQIGQPPQPIDVTNFIVSQEGNTVIMHWDDIEQIVGFNISYGEQGGTYEDSQYLTKGTRATEITTSKVPPGDWTFWAVAVDIAGGISPIPAQYDFTVIDNNEIISEQNYIRAYNDAVNTNSRFTNFADVLMVRHWTGKLIPKGNFDCDHYEQVSAPASSDVQLDSVAGGNLDDTTYYVQTTFQTAGGETTASSEITIDVDAGYLPTVFIPLSAFPTSTDGTVLVHGWNAYLSTASGTELKQNDHTLGYIVDTVNAGNPGDEVYQMQPTGLVTGSTTPGQNTTGWDVFNVFVPDPVTTAYFYSPNNPVDTLVDADKRVWMTASLIPGPTEDGAAKTIDSMFQLISCQSSKFLSSFSFPTSSDRSHILPGVTMAIVNERWVYSYLAYQPEAGNVCYVDDFKMVIDNPVDTQAISGVPVSSSGTTVNFADYDLYYHETPTVQATIASGTAVTITALNQTRTSVDIALSDGVAAVGGAVNLSITGI